MASTTARGRARRQGRQDNDAEGRMSLGQHLIELRNRLFRAVLAVVIAAVGGWFLTPFVLDSLRQPVAELAKVGLADKLDRFPSTVVVSQGTVDNRDPETLLVPALTALAGGDHLVVACTGRRHTATLRARFPHDNVVVEDWVDFDTLLPRADLFISNGGYGSIMHALMSEVPRP